MTSQYGISSPPSFSDRKLSSSELHHNHHYEYVSMDASSSSLSSSMKLDRSFSATSTPDSQMRCNKRSKFSPYGLNGSHHHNHPPVAARRNERERNRVKLVNMGFSTLRQHVPNGAKNKKMSKVETLRSAVDYIRQLQQLLGEGSENIRTTNENLESSSPLSSTSSGAGSSLDPYQLTHQQVSSSSSPSGHETSSPISSTTHSPSYDSSEVSFQDRERCSISNNLHQLQSNNNNASFSASDEDIISFSKWFS